MQKIDYLLGRPLCFFASLIELITGKLLRVRSDSEKILFIELSEMGSAIIAGPTILEAISKFGKENVYFLIFKRNQESISIQQVIPYSNIITIKDSDLLSFFLSSISTIIKVRKLKFSHVFDLELFSRCTALLSWISGAKCRVGFGSSVDEGPYRGHLFDKEVRYNSHLHMSLNFLTLFRAGINSESAQYLKQALNTDLNSVKISVKQEDIECIKKKLNYINQPIILLNPDAGSLPLRGWPLEHWQQIANKFEQQLSEYAIVVVGIRQATELNQKIADLSKNGRIINFAGKTANIAELLALMSISKLLITCDSGPAHFASLVDLNCITLFGPETPELYKPLGSRVFPLYQGLACSPCFSAYNHRQSLCKDNVCLKSISVDNVFQLSKQILEQ